MGVVVRGSGRIRVWMYIRTDVSLLKFCFRILERQRRITFPLPYIDGL